MDNKKSDKAFWKSLDTAVENVSNWPEWKKSAFGIDDGGDQGGAMKIRHDARCGGCGARSNSPRNVKGKKFVYKGYLELECSVDLYLMTCHFCGNIPLAKGEIKLLNAALEFSMLKLERESGGL